MIVSLLPLPVLEGHCGGRVSGCVLLSLRLFVERYSGMRASGF